MAGTAVGVGTGRFSSLDGWVPVTWGAAGVPGVDRQVDGKSIDVLAAWHSGINAPRGPLH
jgi:hypothetical protein